MGDFGSRAVDKGFLAITTDCCFPRTVQKPAREPAARVRIGKESGTRVVRNVTRVGEVLSGTVTHHQREYRVSRKVTEDIWQEIV